MRYNPPPKRGKRRNKTHEESKHIIKGSVNIASGSLECQGKAYYRSEELEPIVYSVVSSYLNSLKESDTYRDLMWLQEEQRVKLEKAKISLMKSLKSVQRDIDTLQEYIPAALRGEGAFNAELLSSMLKKVKCESDKKIC